MPVDPQERKKKRYELRRSISDMGMGLIIFCFGVFLVIANWFGITFTIQPFFRYCLAVLFIVYGAWRIYRGYRKNYYSEE